MTNISDCRVTDINFDKRITLLLNKENSQMFFFDVDSNEIDPYIHENVSMRNPKIRICGKTFFDGERKKNCSNYANY